MHSLRIRIVSSVRIHFSVLSNVTELANGFATRIERGQRFCIPKSRVSCSYEQLPQTVQQYSSADFISALYSIFLAEIDKFLKIDKTFGSLQQEKSQIQFFHQIVNMIVQAEISL